jgi:hypothetical protein
MYIICSSLFVLCSVIQVVWAVVCCLSCEHYCILCSLTAMDDWHDIKDMHETSASNIRVQARKIDGHVCNLLLIVSSLCYILSPSGCILCFSNCKGCDDPIKRARNQQLPVQVEDQIQKGEKKRTPLFFNSHDPLFP